jgi:hypothetical protein
VDTFCSFFASLVFLPRYDIQVRFILKVAFAVISAHIIFATNAIDSRFIMVKILGISSLRLLQFLLMWILMAWLTDLMWPMFPQEVFSNHLLECIV